ncbi:MAG TPA: AmmeMemoRadiSam system protein A [Firmicutes bacterium]|nr:AmmeMemoRadiSam system protein A [Bacillota bacterium]
MGSMLLCALSPHPPLLIPDIGGEDLARVAKTENAMKKLASMVKAAGPETIIVISPHALVFQDAIAIHGAEILQGNFGAFGAREVSLSFRNNLKLVAAIAKKASQEGIRIFRLDEQAGRLAGYRYRDYTSLDHGVLVPMYYLREAGVTAKLVAMGTTFLNLHEVYKFGRALREAIEEEDVRAVVIASGDLSHRLLPAAPAGYDPQGAVFDERIIALLREVDVEGVLGLDESLVERAGECGYRPIISLLGTLDGLEATSEVLSYEGPFGVGYGVVVFRPGRPNSDREFMRKISARQRAEVEERRRRESPIVRLARSAVEEYVRRGNILAVPGDLPPELSGRAGVFCSIKKHGQLRGCIGTVAPTRASIAEEVIRNAIAAATEDPRFAPVEPHELDDLVYSVDILTPPEKVAGLDELDPKRYGVIVRRGGRSGLLLPDLEGIDTAAKQVEIAKRKAGIRPDEDVELERFEVVRYF